MSDIKSLFDLTGRSAVVTGGAGLLGTRFCRTLASAGARVYLADRNLAQAQKAAADLSGEGLAVRAVELDVTDPDSVRSLAQAVVDESGSFDILVNSAALDPKFDPSHGQSYNQSFEDYPLSDWKQAIDVNLTGVFLCCQAAARQMLKQEKSVIINICSIYGLVGPDQRIYHKNGQVTQFKPAYYSATKAGVLGLTRYLAAYYAGKGLRVNALTPGGIYNEHDPEFTEAYSSRAILGRMGGKDEMNGALLFLASDASSYMTGANLVVDGGWTAW